MAAKDPDLNPITGKPANSFTAAKPDRELPRPVKAQPFVANKTDDPSGATTASGNAKQVPDVAKNRREAARLRSAHREATAPGGIVDAQLGYRPPAGMHSKDFATLMGARHMFPNEGAARGNPAINEPHEHDPGVTVQRRAEDLSGSEYRKGSAVLAHYGHAAKDPVGSLEHTHERTLNRVIGEHIQAGVEESASQKFYGGDVSTEIPSHPDLDDKHYTQMKAVSNRISKGVGEIATHPEFKSATPDLSHRERMHAATRVLNQAIADTSPNNKFRENDKWPNVEQGEEAVKAGIEGRDPKFISGRIQNNDKAAGRTDDMLHTGNFDTHAYGNPTQAAKTVAFRGAMTDHAATDAYKVSDVHEASVIAPALGTKKALRYTDPKTGRATNIHEDMGPRASKGMQPINKSVAINGPDGHPTGEYNVKHDKGLSRPEEMLAKGAGTVHALNDYASRKVLAKTGLSRGENYSDNVHQMQAAAWGSQQVLRPDVNVSHADQYPVVRDWGAEGHADLTPQGRALFGGPEHSMGPQFRENPNTKAVNKRGDQAHNPTRSKPYPVMPGE